MQALHIAAFIMLLRIRTAVVVPFEDDKFSFVVGELMSLSAAIATGEVGGLVTNLDRRQGNGEQSQNDED